jgi:hypothetical protein
MRILVFGGPDYVERGRIWDALDRLAAGRPITCIIHGACRAGGTDTYADKWAQLNSIYREPYPIDHERDGPLPSAEMIRNIRMLTDSNPEGAVGFPSAHAKPMALLCRRMGLKVWWPYRGDPLKEVKDNGDR